MESSSKLEIIKKKKNSGMRYQLHKVAYHAKLGFLRMESSSELEIMKKKKQWHAVSFTQGCSSC